MLNKEANKNNINTLFNGDISPTFTNENCVLFNADCLEVLKEMEDNSVDLIVSDVPYRIIIGSRCSKNKGYPSKHRGKLFEHDDIKFEEWLPLIYDKLKEGSHCYLMVNPKNIAKLQTEAENVGFVFQQLIIWNKR